MEEIWKSIPGYEGKYEASNFGNIRSLNYNKTGKTKIMKQRLAKNGYLRVTLGFNKKKEYPVHVLIYKTFIGEIKEGMQVNHLNEIKTDNRLCNLSIVTPKENINYGNCIEKIRIANTNNPKYMVIPVPSL